MNDTITFFENTTDQVAIANFGRKMVTFSESGKDMTIPLKILNEITRVGDLMAETGSMHRLTSVDMMVVKYAKKVLS
jgi:hypothetical protein|tara:strand:+ start:16992 stop:17222 length:231 start_codon:yes stop_codon:yes gene_type:complete